MSTEMNTLQSIINQRAEKKLDAEIAAIANFVSKNRLLKFRINSSYSSGNDDPKSILWYAGPLVDRDVKTDESPKRVKISVQDLLGAERTDYMLELKKRWLPIFIEEETQLFLKEFDEMKERVGELSGEVEDLGRRKKDNDDY